MTITLLAKKGGTGKSSASLLLYEAFRQAGKSVTIRDWDPQGTATRALALIGDGQATTDPPGQPDIVIYDTPPSLAVPATGAAVLSADVVLIVATPSPADVWEVDIAAQFVKERNPNAVVRVLFNRVRRSTVLGRLMKESTKQLSIPALAASISARECYQHALGQGWKALDGAAREEVLTLASEVLSLPVGQKKRK